MKEGIWAEGIREQGAEEILGAEMEEVTRSCRALHYKNIRDLYSLSNMYYCGDIRRLRWWIGYVARMGEKRNMSTILVVKPEETGWNPSNMWEDNVKIDLKYTAWWESVYTRYICPRVGTNSSAVNMIMILGVV